jgi:hypothetical protein
VGDNGPIDGTLKVLSDGLGTNLPMEASTTGVNFTGNLTQSGTALQPVLVSGTNIKTINSTSILGSGNIAVVTSPSGVAGAIQFSNGSAFASDASNLFWDDTNKRVGVGTNAPTATTHIKGSGSTSASTSLLVQNSAGLSSLQVNDAGSVFNNGGGAVATNTAFGNSALIANTTGSANTAYGNSALTANTTGSNNTAVGFQAFLNGTGNENTAIGSFALSLGTSGTRNTAIGFESMFNNTGNFSVGIGYRSLKTNTTGGSNTALGYESSFLNTTGSNNTAIGNTALRNNSTGSNNTSLGQSALTANTASNNTAVGFEAASTNTAGTGITAIGYQALRLSTGNNNTALGFQAGDNITTGAGNVCIGSGAEPLTATANNQFVVGSATTNAGSVTTESNLSLKVWNVIINGVAQKILLA